MSSTCNCKLCNLDAASKQSRWPAPVEPNVLALQQKLPAAVEACHVFRKATPCTGESTMYAKADLVKHVKGLYQDLDTINTARDTWWQSKKELRLQLREQIENERKTQNFKAATQGERARQAQESAQEKMNKLQAINARAMDMLKNMRNDLDIVTQRTLQMSLVEISN